MWPTSNPLHSAKWSPWELPVRELNSPPCFMASPVSSPPAVQARAWRRHPGRLPVPSSGSCCARPGSQAGPANPASGPGPPSRFQGWEIRVHRLSGVCFTPNSSLQRLICDEKQEGAGGVDARVGWAPAPSPGLRGCPPPAGRPGPPSGWPGRSRELLGHSILGRCSCNLHLEVA